MKQKKKGTNGNYMNMKEMFKIKYKKKNFFQKGMYFFKRKFEQSRMKI